MNAATINFSRCRWCEKRTGKVQFFNERGEYVIVPSWAMPEEREINDGICSTCLADELVKRNKERAVTV